MSYLSTRNFSTFVNLLLKCSLPYDSTLNNLLLLFQKRLKTTARGRDGGSSIRSSIESGHSASPSSHSTVTSPSHCATGRSSSNSVQPPPGRDEYNKATQTIETAFVPCSNCDAVQSSLRVVGDAMSLMCQSLNMASSLDKFRARIGGISWLSGY